MKQDRIKRAYRKWFTQLDEKVPEEVWPGIEEELDLDDVWSGIDSELRPARRLFPWRTARIAAAVLLLLVSGLAAYRYLSRNTPGPAREQVVTGERQPDGDPAEGMNRRSAPPAAGRSSGNPASGGMDQLLTGPDTSSPGLPRGPVSVRPEKLSADGLVDAPDRGLESHAAYNQPASGSLPDTAGTSGLLDSRLAGRLQASLSAPPEPVVLPADQPLPLPKRSGSSLARNGQLAGAARERAGIRLEQIGVVSAYNNTWLLNHETFNGLRASSLNSTSVTYGIDAGLTGSFLLNQQHRIGAELYFSSRMGQRYQQYIGARYLNRDIRLNYYKMQLFYQLPVFSGSGNTAGQTGLSGDVIAGGYLSYLSSGREEIGDQPRTVGNQYRSLDYGLMTGFQLNLPVKTNLYLQPGFRVSYGLPNIFKGDQTLPGNFRRTHNASAGFFLGLSYKFYP